MVSCTAQEVLVDQEVAVDSAAVNVEDKWSNNDEKDLKYREDCQPENDN